MALHAPAPILSTVEILLSFLFRHCLNQYENALNDELFYLHNNGSNMFKIYTIALPVFTYYADHRFIHALTNHRLLKIFK